MCSGTNPYFLVKTSSKNGYTLIEVLVAMAIFTAMLVLAGTALNQGLHQYQGLVEKGVGFWEYAKIIWIEKSFNSISDYYVRTRSDKWFPYFIGDQDGISYVSLAPFAGETPVVVWIKREVQAGGTNTLRYYELPVYTKTYSDIEREEILGDYKKGKSFSLLEDAEGVAFSYYSCDITNRQCRWTDMFDGGKMKTLPLSIKIDYKQKGEKGALNLDINVSSSRASTYNDKYP